MKEYVIKILKNILIFYIYISVWVGGSLLIEYVPTYLISGGYDTSGNELMSFLGPIISFVLALTYGILRMEEKIT